MARNNRSAKEKQQERANVIPTKRPEIYTAEYAGYLVCDLLEKHEKELETYSLTFEELLTWMEQLVDSGYKIIQTFSKDGASVRVELHQMDRDDDLAGWRLSAFADSLFNALTVLHYKQERILGGDWTLAAQSRNRRTYG